MPVEEFNQTLSINTLYNALKVHKIEIDQESLIQELIDFASTDETKDLVDYYVDILKNIENEITTCKISKKDKEDAITFIRSFLTLCDTNRCKDNIIVSICQDVSNLRIQSSKKDEVIAHLHRKYNKERVENKKEEVPLEHFKPKQEISVSRIDKHKALTTKEILEMKKNASKAVEEGRLSLEKYTRISAKSESGEKLKNVKTVHAKITNNKHDNIIQK